MEDMVFSIQTTIADTGVDPMRGKRPSTLESFEFQWRHLPEAPFLISDPIWRENVSKFIIDELKISEDTVRGTCVLDAGCGNGRWSYGFEKLGCRVFGFDTSQSGVDYARHNVPTGCFAVADILDYERLLSLYCLGEFDIIWCWGVLHHTGDPERALRNLIPLLRLGGVVHLYLYGKKSLTNHLLRWFFSLFSLKHRVWLAELLARWNGQSVHCNFDAFSPAIADECDELEVRTWFGRLGLSYERVYPSWAAGSTDLFVNGRRERA